MHQLNLFRAEHPLEAWRGLAPAESPAAQGASPRAVGQLVQRDAARSAAGQGACLPEVKDLLIRFRCCVQLQGHSCRPACLALEPAQVYLPG